MIFSTCIYTYHTPRNGLASGRWSSLLSWHSWWVSGIPTSTGTVRGHGAERWWLVGSDVKKSLKYMVFDDVGHLGIWMKHSSMARIWPQWLNYNDLSVEIDWLFIVGTHRKQWWRKLTKLLTNHKFGLCARKALAPAVFGQPRIRFTSDSNRSGKNWKAIKSMTTGDPRRLKISFFVCLLDSHTSHTISRSTFHHLSSISLAGQTEMQPPTLQHCLWCGGAVRWQRRQRQWLRRSPHRRNTENLRLKEDL